MNASTGEGVLLISKSQQKGQQCMRHRRMRVDTKQMSRVTLFFPSGGALKN